MRSLASGVLAFSLAVAGCGGGQAGPKWPDSTQKWYGRAELSYRHGDLEDAERAMSEALRGVPRDPTLRLLGAKIALARLDFAKAIELTQGIPTAEARGIRGRAYWYSSDLAGAARELGSLASDPEVRDPWAIEVAELARTGQGRHPFEMTGGIVTAIEMARAGSTAMIIEVEMNGADCLALIATDSPETVVDSSDKRGAWLSLRFGGKNPALPTAEKIEVSDVPALGRDLSGIQREFKADIKLLIGVNLLRHLRPTIDYAGRQFVVRTFDPPPPPAATTVHPIYYRGGALALPVTYGTDESAPLGTVLMHTSMTFPVALDNVGWKKAGQNPDQFAPVVGRQGLREGNLPFLRLGTFDLNNIPGVYGAAIADVEKVTEADLDGFAGSGLFATLRLTLADSGRTLWLEDLPPEVLEIHRAAAERRAAPALLPEPSVQGPPPAAPPVEATAPAPPAAAAPSTPAPAKKKGTKASQP